MNSFRGNVFFLTKATTGIFRETKELGRCSSVLAPKSYCALFFGSLDFSKKLMLNPYKIMDFFKLKKLLFPFFVVCFSLLFSACGEQDKIELVQIPNQDWSIGKYEVTQAQYAKVMGKPFKNAVKESWLKEVGQDEEMKDMIAEFFRDEGGFADFFADDKPAIFVSWNDAMTFCKNLTAQECRAGRLPAGYKYMLPTSAQWELACRAGTTTKFCSGDSKDDLSRVAWWFRNSGRKTHPVGTKEPNAWGIHDMHGNVGEWCLDEYPRFRSFRVNRAGSYVSAAAGCESSYVYYHNLDDRHHALGFRVVLVPADKQ